MPINSLVNYQQALSSTMEQRSSAVEDLVSNSNILYNTLKRKGLVKSYSGPRIRQTLQIDKPTGQWYSGYDILANRPKELFNDAYFTPKMVAVPISLSNEEILNNDGPNQIFDILEEYVAAAERGLRDTMDQALYSDGTAGGGKQLGGLNVALPIVNTTGTYGSIDRAAYPIWRPGSYDVNSAFAGITQFSSTTARSVLNQIFAQRSRGTRAADLLIMSPEHWGAYDASLVAIQRITSDNGPGKMGFTSMQYVGAGRQVDIVMEGGYGSNMPSNTTFGIETDSFRLRYNPGRNFSKIFPGDGQMPINQDAMAQFWGWMGELTMTNPLFSWRLYDSNPNA